MFIDTINFSADWGGTDIKTSAALAADIFLTKIKNDGSYLWTKIFGGTQVDYVRAAELDNYDNIYLGGYYRDTVNFASDWGLIDSHTSVGAIDGYIIKIYGR